MQQTKRKVLPPVPRNVVYPMGGRPFKKRHHRISARGIAIVRAQEGGQQ